MLFRSSLADSMFVLIVVDLGIDNKIKNIEETEKLKREMLMKKHEKYTEHFTPSFFRSIPSI